MPGGSLTGKCPGRNCCWTSPDRRYAERLSSEPVEVGASAGSPPFYFIGQRKNLFNSDWTGHQQHCRTHPSFVAEDSSGKIDPGSAVCRAKHPCSDRYEGISAGESAFRATSRNIQSPSGRLLSRGGFQRRNVAQRTCVLPISVGQRSLCAGLSFGCLSSVR